MQAEPTRFRARLGRCRAHQTAVSRAVAFAIAVAMPACTDSSPQPTPKSDVERADEPPAATPDSNDPPAENAPTAPPAPPPAPESVAACPGAVKSFSFRYGTGTIAKRHGYTITGKPAGDQFAVQYEWKGWPRQLDKGGIELKWKGKLEGEEADRVRELLASDILAKPKSDRMKTGGSTRSIHVEHEGDCERYGLGARGWQSLGGDLRKKAREALGQDANGNLALGKRKGKVVYAPPPRERPPI